MASVDGGRSLLAASDETHACDPCKTEDIDREAGHYCVECQEYLCDSCKQSHQKFKLSKNHDVLSESEVPKHASTEQQTSFTVYCSCNQNREVEVYCEEHGDVICNSCKALSHRRCKLSSLRDKARTYSSEKLQSVLDKTKSTKDRIGQLHKEKKAKVSNLERLTDECKKEITLFREELNTYLDKIEQNMLKNLETLQEKQTIALDEEIASLAAALERLSLDLKMLEHAKHFDTKETMFASEIKVSKSHKEYETLAGDLQKNDVEPVLSFERNKTLTDIMRNVDTIGCLKSDTKVNPCREKRLSLELKELKIRSSRQVDVASLSGKNKPWISGCCFMPNGDIVICDYENDTLILLDQNFASKDKLNLKTGPYGVLAVDNNNVIVTLPNKQQIQYIQVFPTIMAGRVIQFDKDCFGIYVSGGKLYISFAKYDKGEIRILDPNGILEKKINVNHDGRVLFQLPYCITVSETGNEIFVSDGKTDTVTCMSADGHVIYQCKDDEIKGLRGIYVDAGNNVYVCGTNTNNVGLITADGRFCRSLVPASEGIKMPRSVAFRGTDRTLLVCCGGATKLFCFKF